MECLRSIFQENEPIDAEQEEEAVHYTVGGLVGQMSVGVIPRQPGEDNTRELQEKFLAKVMRQYGASGQALANMIRQFWAMQDQLAQTLDADTFDQMFYRGAEKCF